MSTIKEVAEHANVARSTVSRVMNGGSVSEDTRRRVTEAMAALNFQPNAIARSLATSRTGALGMVVSDMEGPFFGGLMQHAEQTIRAQGKHLIVTSGHGKAADERDAIAFLRERRCDALLLHVDELPDDELISLAQQIPTVILNRSLPQLSGQCVYLDNEQGGYMATQHLLEHGHTQIAHISGPMQKQDARDRLQGYRRALEEAGRKYDPVLVVEGDYQEACGAESVKKLLKRAPQISAVFCANDYMAFGAIQAIKELGLRVPEDISVMGFDDIVFARYLTPQLTTIRYPVDQLGHVGAQLALSSLEKPAGSTSEALPAAEPFLRPELVERQTVARFSAQK